MTLARFIQPASLLAAAALTFTLAAPAQQLQVATDLVTVPQIFFAFERQGLPVPKYELTVRRDGSVVYAGEQQPPVAGPDPTSVRPPQSFRTEAGISPATASRIFALAQKLNHFNATCASKAKNIADTGTKILTYRAADGSGSCTYNYTENKDVQVLTDIFLGVAETMDEGRELDRLHRYDRLGLDAAMTFLVQEISAGHAIEVGTIAASLRSLTADPEVMERVRTRAGRLLSQVPTDAPTR